LTKPGEGIKFTEVPTASKLAIRYKSVKVGTISVAVNDQKVILRLKPSVRLGPSVPN
jgi:hypothetical protein